MPAPDSRLIAELSSTVRLHAEARTVESAPGPAADRRFGRRSAVVVATCVLVAAGAVVVDHVLGHRNAVPVVGTWFLQEIDHDGRPTVLADDLVEYRSGVPVRFDAPGTFAIQSGCGTTNGHYDVSWDELTVSDWGGNASGCGYATASAEHLSTAIGRAVDALFDEKSAVVSRPGEDRLELSVDDGAYVLRYHRATG